VPTTATRIAHVAAPAGKREARIGEVETTSTCRRERLEGKIQERYGLAKD
jgi:hypothetical protein